MKVYALVSSYYNGGESFETITDLYRDRFDAIIESNRLENENSDPGQSYWIKEMKVK